MTPGKATAIGLTSDFRPLRGFLFVHSRLAKIGLAATGKALGSSSCQARGSSSQMIGKNVIGLLSSLAGIDPSGGVPDLLADTALA